MATTFSDLNSPGVAGTYFIDFETLRVAKKSFCINFIDTISLFLWVNILAIFLLIKFAKINTC